MLKRALSRLQQRLLGMLPALQSLIVAARQSHTVVLALDVLRGQLQGMSLYIAATAAVQTNFSSTQPSAATDTVAASLWQHMVVPAVAGVE
jgi:hypothetical protein